MNNQLFENTSSAINSSNVSLRDLLKKQTLTDKHYWSFNKNAKREYSHAYFQYPAMMVPQMQSKLIQSVVKTEKNISLVLDPFVGSGTTLTECMMQGLDFVGQDINPLAILLCKTKSGPFYITALRNKTEDLMKVIKNDHSKSIEIDFSGIDKWFINDVKIDLSKIRRGIENEPSLWVRRFYWVALAETIRQCSNSRTSTFKLHIKPQDEIEGHKRNTIQKFSEIISRNIEKMSNQRIMLQNNQLLKKGSYIRDIKIKHQNSAEKIFSRKDKYDLLITSPPYGDNRTTVPYGEHSYLPLQWIPFNDIDKKMDNNWIRTTRQIDYKSLGGSLNEIEVNDINSLKEISPSFKKTMNSLSNKPDELSKKVYAFCRDLDLNLSLSFSAMREGGIMIWTIGNRRVGGKRIPMDKILFELFDTKGVQMITKIERKIPMKRMPYRNDTTSTMIKESVLILRKIGESKT